MSDPANDRTAGGVCLLIAVVLLIGSLLWVVCIARCHAALPAPLEGLLARLEAPGTPAWKTALIGRIRERRIRKFTGTITAYCPFDRKTGQGCVWRGGRWNPVDPPGGGLYARTGVKLRWGHVAVDPRVIPLHSVLVVDGIDHLMLAVDTGGAIDGNDVDIACPEPDLYFAMAKRFSYTKAACWILRRGKT